MLDKTSKGYQFSNSSTVINHLVYMDDIKLYGRSQQEIESLIRTVNIFFDDIHVSIGATKCNITSVHRGHLVESNSVVLSSGDIIHPLSPEGFNK